MVTFVLTRIVPADPALVATGGFGSPETLERLRSVMGLDRPLPIQYLLYMRGVFLLDFGRSIQTQRPVKDDLKEFFPATVELALAVMLVYIAVSIPLGIAAATHQNRPIDYIIRLAAIVGVGLPAFWLGMLLQLTFYGQLGWFPAASRMDPMVLPPQRISGLYVIDSLLTANWPALQSSLHHLALPTAAAAMSRLGVGLKLTRIAVIEVLSEDFIRTARSKGLTNSRVVYKHALRNALIPIVTQLGIHLGYLLSGTVIVEVVFAWPGIGRYAVGSITTLDFPAIMSVTLLIASMFLVLNLFVDMLYVWLDPRIIYS